MQIEPTYPAQCDASFSDDSLPPPTKFSRKAAKSGHVKSVKSAQDKKKSLEFLLAYRAAIARTIKNDDLRESQNPYAVSDIWTLELQS